MQKLSEFPDEHPTPPPYHQIVRGIRDAPKENLASAFGWVLEPDEAEHARMVAAFDELEAEAEAIRLEKLNMI